MEKSTITAGKVANVPANLPHFVVPANLCDYADYNQILPADFSLNRRNLRAGCRKFAAKIAYKFPGTKNYGQKCGKI